MSAERLRVAAALMRSRAEAATEGPWEAHIRSVTEEATHPHVGWISTAHNRMTVVENAWDGDVLYLASWHPAVALAVAAWLDDQADLDEVLKANGARGFTDESACVKVADAYLGSAS